MRCPYFPLLSRIARALDRLAIDPYGAGNVKALNGGSYRFRVGDWRVIYTLKEELLLLLVLVVKVGHRRDIYRG